jgi:hypothetical protein
VADFEPLGSKKNKKCKSQGTSCSKPIAPLLRLIETKSFPPMTLVLNHSNRNVWGTGQSVQNDGDPEKVKKC